MSLGRRSFLTGAGALGAGAALDRVLGPGGARAAATTGRHPLEDRVPFEGPHQPGVLEPRPAAAVFCAFDAIAESPGELADALRALSDHGRRLMHGYDALVGAPGAGPTPDSGILGTRVRPDALTVTVGLGASLFDRRYGLAGRRPRGLEPMPPFPDDDLVAGETHGDVLLQLCAGSQDTLLHALRDLMRATRGALAPRWKVEGFLSAPREPGAARNLLGFKDGTANPDPADRRLTDRLLWVGRGEGPDWTMGGTFSVVRVIRNRVEFWDRVSRAEQELMIGRDKVSGAPLGRRREHDGPGYHEDPHGRRIPLDAHIRLARPRTPATEDSRILRRSFSYSRGIDAAGQLDMGLIFCSFQRDLERQFAATQRRLADEPLVDYIVPTGGGYFFLPRGARDGQDWVGSGLFA